MRRRQLVVLAVLACGLSSAARAVPTVFSEGVTIRADGVSDGYVLMAAAGRAKLVDADGNVVHTWSGTNGPLGIVTKPLDGGHVLTGSGTSAVELDWYGNVVWQFDPPEEDVTFHHDLERLPNGNTLVLCRHLVDAPAIADDPADDDFILEVTPAGDVVWEWHTVDHIDELGFSEERRALIREQGENWSHANAISVIPENTSHADPRFAPGNVIISYRAQNTVAIIDRATGSIVWSMTDRTIGQHNAHMIPDDLPGGGDLLVFDNGWNGQFTIAGRFFSRVVEIDPVTLTFPWTYDATQSGYPSWTFYSGIISSAQRLPDGNTLITEGTNGRVFEVTPDGGIVWEYVNDWVGPNNTRNVYRAYKVPPDWADTRFAPDLVVSAEDVPSEVPPGAALRAVFQVENEGAEPAIDVAVEYTVSPEVAFLFLSAPEAWNCTTPEVGASGTIRCTARSLGAGEGALFSVVSGVDPCIGDNPVLVHDMSASSIGEESSPADNRTTVETTVTRTLLSGTDRPARRTGRCSNRPRD